MVLFETVVVLLFRALNCNLGNERTVRDGSKLADSRKNTQKPNYSRKRCVQLKRIFQNNSHF